MGKVINRIFSHHRVSDIVRGTLQHGFRAERSEIRAYLGGGGKVLDLGCGTGCFSDMFDRKDYVGIDVDATAIAYARKRHAGYTFLRHEKRYPFPDHTFDSILVNAVFHHIPDRLMDGVLAEVSRVAKPGAKILVMDTVPVADQQSKLGRFLFSRDQGRDAKDVKKMEKMLRKRFSVRSSRLTRTGPYTLQVYRLTPLCGRGASVRRASKGVS